MNVFILWKWCQNWTKWQYMRPIHLTVNVVHHVSSTYHYCNKPHFKHIFLIFFLSLQHAIANRPTVFYTTLVSLCWCMELFNRSANCKYDTSFMPYFISLRWLQPAFLDIFTLVCGSYFLYIAKCCKLLYVVSCTV